MKKAIITSHQLMTITTAFVCGASTLIISSSVTALAGQDAWISTVVATLFGLVIVWINTYLGGLYPNKTYVDIIQILFGKWIGGLVVASFIYVCIVGGSQFVWYIGDFFTTQYMPQTPPYVIIALFVIAIVVALHYGIEAIARISEIFFYGIIVMFVLSMLLVAPNIEIDYVLPIFEKGFVPILKGSFPLLAFSVFPLIFLNMIYPLNIADIGAAKKSIFKGFLIGMAITFVSVSMCNLVMGSTITSNLRFPIFYLTKEINVGVIFTRLEALIVTVWLFTIFNNTVFYFYAGIIGLKQLLRLKDHKIIILPLGLIIVVISGFVYNNVPYEIKWDTEIWLMNIGTYGFIVTSMLLCVHFIKKHILSQEIKNCKK